MSNLSDFLQTKKAGDIVLMYDYGDKYTKLKVLKVNSRFIDCETIPDPTVIMNGVPVGPRKITFRVSDGHIKGEDFGTQRLIEMSVERADQIMLERAEKRKLKEENNKLMQELQSADYFTMEQITAIRAIIKPVAVLVNV